MLEFEDAAALADAYAQGRQDPVDVFEAACQKARSRPEVFLDVFDRRGRREAEASRARWRAGAPLSPFDGIPLAWKDLFDVAGSVTTAASATRTRAPAAERDAVLVRRLAQAGMVSIGKTNLSEFAYSGLGLNPHYGTPASPIAADPPRAPGGSSSGSAVAVAAGIVPIAMGTDTAGSIRIPAAFNGLVGYRASRRRYSAQGIWPLATSLDTSGPLARSVRDVIVLDNLLRGCDSADSAARQPSELAALRLCVDPFVLESRLVSPAVKACLNAALDTLRRAGARLESRPLSAWHDTQDLIEHTGWLGAAEAFALHEALLDSPQAEQLDPRVRARLERSRHVPASVQVRLYQARERLLQEAGAQLDGALLITPTVAHVAPPLEPLERDPELFARVNLATLRLTMPGSFLDMPGVSLPCGVDDAGLPVGLLVSGHSGADVAVLRGALALEKALAGRARPY